MDDANPNANSDRNYTDPWGERAETTTRVDQEAIAKYAGIVFSGLEGFVAVRLLAENGTDPKPQSHFEWLAVDQTLAANLGKAARYAAKIPGLASYAIPGIVAKRGHARAEHVIATQVMLADLDSGRTEVKLAHLRKHVGAPSLVVESGGVTAEGQAKLHVYWRLTEPADAKRVAVLRHDLAIVVGGDSSFQKPSQPIRVAGTIYRKGGVCKVSTIREANDVAYELSELARSIEAMPTLSYEERGNPVPTGAGQSSRKRTPIKERLARKVREGGVDGETRFEALSSAIGLWISLCRAGAVTRTRAWRSIKNYNDAYIDPPWSKERLWKETVALCRRDKQKHPRNDPPPNGGSSTSNDTGDSADDASSGRGAQAKSSSGSGPQAPPAAGGRLGAPQWREVGKGGKPKARSQKNILAFLKWRGVTLRRNEFTCRDEITIDGRTGELGDSELRQLRLEADALDSRKEFFEDVCFDQARQTGYHPVRDYLSALEWDRTPRLDRWQTMYAGATDTELNRAIGRKTLIAAVRRIREPGCKFDNMLVWEGPQGQWKSTAFRRLATDAWFTDSLHIGDDDKHTIEQTAGKWIAELPELAGIRRRDVEPVKAMLSRQVDRARPAYARHAIDCPRQFILVGTVNEAKYLKDTTGNRRFWPVKVERIDLAALARDRDQLWAEAAHYEAEGEPVELTETLWKAAAEEQTARVLQDPWFEILAPLLDGNVGTIDKEEIWTRLGLPKERRDRVAGERLGKVMEQLGFESGRFRRCDGTRPYCFTNERDVRESDRTWLHLA
jgi:hypothetical protein